MTKNITKNMTTDDKTLNLIREIKQRKEEIAKIEKPNWITNCSFSYSEGKNNSVINIHVESSVRELCLIAAFLNEKAKSYESVAEQMGIEAPPFTWSGYSVNDWLSDIKMRINKIQIASKRKKLEEIEARLNKIISPELQAEIELENIMNELKEN